MCKEAGKSDQSPDLGAHLWVILMSDFLRASPQAKRMITILSWLKYLQDGMMRQTSIH